MPYKLLFLKGPITLCENEKINFQLKWLPGAVLKAEHAHMTPTRYLGRFAVMPKILFAWNNFCNFSCLYIGTKTRTYSEKIWMFLKMKWWISQKNEPISKTIPQFTYSKRVMEVINLNKYETAQNFIQLNQNLTSDCLLI